MQDVVSIVEGAGRRPGACLTIRFGGQMKRVERRIVLRSGGFMLIEELGAEVKEKALVPGWLYEFGDVPAAFRMRLDSTRGGNAAWWGGKDILNGVLNDAPYNPVLRGFVDKFIWLPPSSRDNRLVWGEHTHETLVLKTKEPGWVVQGGSATINWAARVVAPLPDLVRDVMVEVLEGVDWSDSLVQRQGALELRVVYGVPEEKIGTIPPAGNGYRRLFNHYIYPLDRFAWRVVNGIAYALFVPARGECMVVSPDHEDDWLKLIGRVFVARHPLPRRADGVVD